MWPWGHLAVGYLLYAGFARWRDDAPPTGSATFAVLFGTQFPDLVDKPLAWTFSLLPSGRSLAHSALTMLVVCVAVGVYARRHGRLRLAVAFAVGYASHLGADALAPLMAGDLRDLAYLGWPLLTLPPAEPNIGFVGEFSGLQFTPYVWLQFALAALAVLLWLRDGRPGLAALRGWVGSWRRTAEH